MAACPPSDTRGPDPDSSAVMYTEYIGPKRGHGASGTVEQKQEKKNTIAGSPSGTAAAATAAATATVTTFQK